MLLGKKRLVFQCYAHTSSDGIKVFIDIVFLKNQLRLICCFSDLTLVTQEDVFN